MDAEHRKKLVRQRAVAKSSLTRLQNFIETGEHKLHDLQARYEELPNIFCKFETAQNELETTDDVDYSVDRESFEQQYNQSVFTWLRVRMYNIQATYNKATV